MLRRAIFFTPALAAPAAPVRRAAASAPPAEGPPTICDTSSGAVLEPWCWGARAGALGTCDGLEARALCASSADDRPAHFLYPTEYETSLRQGARRHEVEGPTSGAAPNAWASPGADTDGAAEGAAVSPGRRWHSLRVILGLYHPSVLHRKPNGQLLMPVARGRCAEICARLQKGVGEVGVKLCVA